jgi:ABC-type branched-subunit amino acid transport system substrate-binding protein
MLQGATLAIEQANSRGGYRGKKPYKLVVRNDNGNWRSSGREIIMLAYKDSVWAVLGTIDGANSHIAIRAALKAEISVVNSADTDPTYVETNIPWVFRCITDDRQMCYLLADFAFKKLKLERVAALRATNRYGRMSIDEFRDAATRLGRPFVTELQYQEGDTDFQNQLKQIKSLNVDGVITYGNSKESALILKQMRKLGMNQWYLGSDRMVTDEFIKIVGENFGKVAAAYPYNPARSDHHYKQFVEDFSKRFGEYPETYAAHAFDGMNMIITAMERAGLNRALIRDELSMMHRYEGVTGRKEFDAVFTNRSPAALAIIKNGKYEFYTQEEIFSNNIKVIQ